MKNSIYKQAASQIARNAHARQNQRMPDFDKDNYDFALAREIAEALIGAAGGMLTQDKVPETDGQVEQLIREIYTPAIGDTMLGLYRIERAEDQSVKRAWAAVLLKSVGETTPDWVEKL